MVKCKTVDIKVPAEAEFIIEGYVDPAELRVEGPFGDHTGYYSLKGDYPVFHVTAVTRRRNPVYSATIVGKPPMEDCYMALATERIFLPMIKTVLPEIKDYMLPWEGVFHNIAVVAIDKEFPRHAVKVMNGLWGSGQMSFAKMLVIVDDEKILKDRENLLRHLLDTVDVTEDITVTKGILDVLDHSADRPLYGSKLGIDATGRIEGEDRRGGRAIHGKLSRKKIEASALSIDKKITGVRIAFDKCRSRVIMLCVRKDKKANSQYFIKKVKNSFIKDEGIIVLYDHDVDLGKPSLLLWKLFNNVDPSRDMFIDHDLMIIDATRKGMVDGHSREWPDDIEMSGQIKSKVDALLAGEKGFL